MNKALQREEMDWSERIEIAFKKAVRNSRKRSAVPNISNVPRVGGYVFSNLKALRLAKGVSRGDIVRASNMSQASIMKLEKGTPVKFESAIKIFDYLNNYYFDDGLNFDDFVHYVELID